MANKRVTDTTLPENFADGKVLYGSDLNKIIAVLKAAVNANKADLDKLLAGDSNALVVYSPEALSALLDSEFLVDGQYAWLYNPYLLGDGIKLYRYNSNTDLFDFVQNVSLINSITRSSIHFEELNDAKIDDLFIDYD